MNAGPRPLLAGTIGLSLAAVAIALLTQHVGGLQPCPWCVLQRLIHLLIAAAALLGLLVPGAIGRRLGAGLALLLAASGIAAALWQHFVASRSASCDLTLADRLVAFTGLDRRMPSVFAAYASCADARADLLGLPYEFWSVALFLLIGLATLQVLRQPR